MVKSRRAIILAILLVMAIPVYSTLKAAAEASTYLPLVYKAPPTATITMTPSPWPTYTPGPPPTIDPSPGPTITSPPPSTGNVVILDIYYDGAGQNEADEYVEIRNDDLTPIELYGWTLSDQANHSFSFPSFVISVSQVCRVYTNENHPEWCGFNYGSAGAIWNNTGDCATLRDVKNTLVDEYCYP